MKYLFTCAIGPVQDFIATARRSRDLWFGSWLLSELSKSAANFIFETYGDNSLIYPAPKDIADLKPNTPYNVPNRILAIISESPETLEKNINEIISIIDKRLEEIKKIAFKDFENHKYFHKKVANEQLKDLIEFYWATIEFLDGENYSEKRQLVDAYLSMRKNTREFSQLKGDNVPKSSLDGNRESVIDEKMYASQNPDDKEYSIEKLYKLFKAKSGERLSGVDLLKRNGKPGNVNHVKFYSTSHFAAVPFMEKHQNNIDDVLKEIEKLYKRKNWSVSELNDDGEILYESRISDVVPIKSEQEELQKSITNVLSHYYKAERPSPYYALLRADGDNMGKTIDAQKNPEDHQKLSQQISQFASDAVKIIKSNKGEAIYAGGEDILAYLPLNTAIHCIDLLNKRFTKMMKDKFYYLDSYDNQITPTLSAGLVIAHHLTPLSETLDLSKEAEKKAKMIKGKHGLCIIENKRGGGIREISGKMDSLIERFNKLIEYNQQGLFSKGTAYEFERLYNELRNYIGEDELQSTEFQEAETRRHEIIYYEAKKILERKNETGKDLNISDEVKNDLNQWLLEVQIDKLAYEMIISNLIAKSKKINVEG